MRRITISLPDDLTAALRRESRRRGVAVSRLVREALDERYGRTTEGKRELPFAALGGSGHRTTSEDVEEILRAEWGRARDR